MMRILSRPILKAFAKVHPDAGSALDLWYAEVRKAHWTNFAEVRRTYPSADLYGRCTIFNIGGNKYRLIAAIHYETTGADGNVVEGRVYIRNVLTHAEYDRDGWKAKCKKETK